MKNHQIEINIKKFRSINQANIVLDGITVIAGENGSGKSTISKLIYHIFKTSIEFERIIDRKLQNDIEEINRVFNLLTVEFGPILDAEDYSRIRSYSRKSRIHQFSLFDDEQFSFNNDESPLMNGINYLIKITKPEIDFKNDKITQVRINRIKQIISNTLLDKSLNKDTDLNTLLQQLKETIILKIESANKVKEERPISILFNSLENNFNDGQLSKSYDIKEYGVSINDLKHKRLLPIHSVSNIAYIDTPMIIGKEAFNSKSHWDDLNHILKENGKSEKIKTIDNIFKNDIIKGDIIYSDDEEYEDNAFRYKRNDGLEFSLLDCATGLKSFAILQLMYKNGFLNKNSLLIIDEPEVHLHPQWVVEYARLIVLLNKKLGVKFLIASHHPDMISAIKYISEKEKIEQDVYFYLAERKENKFIYNYKDLGKDIEPIFSSFNIAFERIDLYGRTE